MCLPLGAVLFSVGGCRVRRMTRNLLLLLLLLSLTRCLTLTLTLSLSFLAYGTAGPRRDLVLLRFPWYRSPSARPLDLWRRLRLCNGRLNINL